MERKKVQRPSYLVGLVKQLVEGVHCLPEGQRSKGRQRGRLEILGRVLLERHVEWSRKAPMLVLVPGLALALALAWPWPGRDRLSQRTWLSA